MDKQIRDISKKRTWKRILKRSVALLCAVVMLFTMNTLKRNADTLERIAMCGYAEHVHSASCFSGDVLVCGMEEHIHTDACYQESPASMDMDDLDIEVDEPIVDETVEDLDLSLELDGLDLVTEDVVAEPVSNEVEEKVYSLGTGAMVSHIIGAVGLGVSLSEIIEVAAVENDEAHSGLIAVEKVDGDYRVWAKRDFAEAELALIITDDIYVVKLTDGIAQREDATPEVQPAIEDASAVQIGADAPAELPAMEYAPAVDAHAGDDDHVEVPVIEDEAPVDGQDEDTLHVEDVSPEAEQQVGKGEQLDIEDVPGEQAGDQGDEQPAGEAGEAQGEEPAVGEAAEGLSLEEAGEEQGDEQPAGEAGEEQGEEPAVGEAAEGLSLEEADEAQGDEQPAGEAGEAQGDGQPAEGSDEAQGDGQPAEGSNEEQGDGQPAEGSDEEQGDGQPAEEANEEQGDGQPAEGSDEEQGEEQPAEGSDEEQGDGQPAEGSDEEQGDGQPSEEADEAQVDGQPSEEADEEQPSEEAADEQSEEEVAEEQATGESESPVYTATIDLAEVEAYPLSLNAMLAAAKPEAAEAEEAAVEGETGEEAALEEEADAEANPTPIIEYDAELLEVVEQDGDWLVTPIRGFEETRIAVDNGSRYELTLVNCVLADEAGEEQEEQLEEQPAPVYTATVDLTDATYPLSLNAMLATVTPALDGEQAAQDDEQPAEAQDDEQPAEAQSEEQPAERPTPAIEYDEALLEIAESDGDRLVTPIQSFENTRIIVENGSRYELTLVNCVLTDEGQAEQPEAAYPAQDFEGRTDYVKVTVSAPEGAFPEGTTMTVADVEDEKTITDIEEKVSEGFVEVKRVHAVDIIFTDAAGNEIEPLVPISVVMTVDEIGQEEAAVLVHVDDAGEAKVVESQSEAPEGETGLKAEMPAAQGTDAADAQQASMDEATEGEAQTEVGFEADSFSVYAVVVTRTLETKYIDAKGDTWNISVRYGAEAEIPDTAALAVSEVTDERYLADAEAALEGGKRVTLARFFDIKIMNGETEVQPKQPVEVSVALDNTEIAAIEPQEHVIDNGETEVCAVHFAGENTDIVTAAEREEAVVFDAAGFSVWGVMYTVDFYYGDYEYHMAGEDSIALSALFGVLGIEADAAQAEAVVFTNPELLAVARLEDGSDWQLTSLAPFNTEEKLTVTMADGAVYEIRVEDDQTDMQMLVNDQNAGYFAETGSGHMFLWSAKTNAYSFITEVKKANDGQIYEFKKWASQNYYSVNAVPRNGFEFAYWLKIDKNGNVSTITKQTITWQDAVNPDEDTYYGVTLIAFFKPVGQSLIRFEAEGSNGYISDSGSDTTHVVTDQRGTKHGWAYSSEAAQAKARGNYGYYATGWYDQSGNQVTSSDFIAPYDITQNTVYTARFAPVGTHAITYKTTWYFTNLRLGQSGGQVYAQGSEGAIITEYVRDGEEAQGATAATHGTGNDYSYFIAWIDADGRQISNSAFFKPVGDQIRDTTYTAVFSSSPTYVVVESDYHCGSVGGSPNYYQNAALDLASANKADHIVLAQYNNNGNLLGDLWPVPNPGFEFDHWEWTPENGQTVRINDQRIYANNSTVKGKGVLKAIFKPKIVYDIGQINWVGINAPDFQHWYTDSWCPPVTVSGLNQDGDENTFSEMASSGSSYTIRNVSSQTRVTQTNTGYNLLTHYFKGWKADRDLVINGQTYNAGTLIPASVVNSGATINNVTEMIRFTAVWSSTFPGKTEYNNNNTQVGYRYNTSSVGFFVRLFDSVFDIGDTNTYTDCLFTTRLSLTGSGNFAQNNYNGTRFDFFGNSKANVQSDINNIDAALRNEATGGLQYSWSRFTSVQQYQDHDGRYDYVTITLDSFPSDDLIFSQIRRWNLTAPSDRKIEISGVKIPQSMITSDFFDIKWYVLKDQENQWHIDGMLIPKYAKLRATKRFVGLSDAFDSAKNGYTITVTETNPREGATQDIQVLTMSYVNGAVNWTYTMKGATYNRVESSGSRWTFRDSAGNLLAVVNSSDNGNRISWSLHHLLPMTAYRVVESGYDSDGYAVTTSHVIENTPQTANLTGGDTAVVERVYNYPDYISESAYQTVAFTNLYTEPWVMSLFKQDGNTLHGLSHVTFDLEVRRSNGEIVTGIPSAHTTNGDGQISIDFPQEAGNYTFTLTEREHEGYDAITTVTGNVSVTADGVVTVSNLAGGVTGANAMVSVDNNNNAVVYIKNTPERVNVKVLKEWAPEATPQPVTMQLLRNGVALNGMSVVLGANEAAASPQMKVTGWEYTWTDLPAYIDGKEVTYTAREEWIGEPGGVNSIHYNLANDPSDGYADYIVYQTITESKAGDITTVSVKMENTPDHGQLVFTKVDTGHMPVAGAVFEVYDIINGVGQSAPKSTTYTSDAQGIVTIDDLLIGDYWLRERSAPVGYDAGAQPYYLLYIRPNNSQMLANDGSGYYTVPTVEIVNEPFTARVKVVKEGINGLKLPGAVFSLHRTETSEVPMRGYASLITDANGEIDLGELKQGTYWLKEITAPEGYQLLTKRVAITVTDDRNAEPVVVSARLDETALAVAEASGMYSVTVPNEFEGHKIRIRKVDSTNSSTRLQNIVFDILTVYDSQDPVRNVQFVPGDRYLEINGLRQTDGTYKTDSEGRIYIGYLPTGTYYLIEKETIAGYEQLEGPVVLQVGTGSASFTMPGQSPVTVSNTDSGGYIEILISNVPHGSLKITKAIAPNSDVSTDQTFTFTVKLTRNDAAYTSPVKITSEGGTEQTVTPNDNGEVTVTTTGAGDALVSDLPGGVSYEVTESSVAGWHVSASQDLTGTIAAGTQSTAAVTNEQLGSLKITKTVTVNGSAPAAGDTHTNGTYEFSIDGLGSTPTEGIHRTVKITFAGGVATSWQIDDGETQPVDHGTNSWSVIVTDLTPGGYTVTEAAPTNDTVLWEASGGTKVDEDKKIFVTVVAQDDATAEPSAPSAQASFTNSYNRVDVKIVKIDESTRGQTTPKKLKEAEFKLIKGDEANGTVSYNSVYKYTRDGNEVEAIETTDDRGELAFGNLPDGYYRIEESGVPAGYIRTSDPYIYFTISGGQLTWTDGNRSPIADTTSEVNLVTYSRDDITFTVGNNPGAALPNTGGMGTTLYYVAGAALLVLALVLLLRRRSEY